MGKPRIIVCKVCGQTKPNKGHGLCQKCYRDTYYIPQTYCDCKLCHKHLIHYALGLCKDCYGRKRRNTDEYRAIHRQQAYNNYHKDPEKFRRKHREYYASEHGKAIVRRSNRKSALNHPDRIKAYSKKYRESNREKVAHNLRIGKAKRKSLPADLTIEQWHNILEFYEYRCAYCRCKSKILHYEHKTPVSKGGAFSASNIVPACSKCNFRKHTMTETEFFEYLKLCPK